MQVNEICVEVKQTLKKAKPNLKNLPVLADLHLLLPSLPLAPD